MCLGVAKRVRLLTAINPNMAGVETMGDDEIRRKLQEFGYENIPVAGSSRDVLVKVLKKLMSKEKPSARRRKKWSGGASASTTEEEDEGEDEPERGGEDRGNGMDHSKWKASPGMPKGRKPSGSSSRRRSETVSDESAASKARQRLKRRSLASTNGDREHKGGSSADLFKRPFDVPAPPSPARPGRASVELPSFGSSASSASSSLASWRTQIPLTNTSNHLRKIRYSDEFDTGSETESGLDTRLHRSRRLRPSPSFSSSSCSSAPSRGKRMINGLSSVVNSFVERFRARTRRVGNGLQWDGDERSSWMLPSSSVLKNTRSSTPNGHCTSPGGGAELSASGFQTTEEETKFWNSQSISRTLLAVVVVFFGFLGLTYCSMCLKDRAYPLQKTTDYNFTVCISETQNDDCIPKKSLVHTVHLFKNLRPELMERAALHQCGTDVSPNMSMEESMHFLKNKVSMQAEDFAKAFDGLKILILDNPACNLQLVNDTGAPAHASTAMWIKAKDVAVPFKCWLWIQMRQILSSAVQAACGGLLIMALYFLIHWYMARRRQQEHEVFFLVERILCIVRAHHLAVLDNQCGEVEPYLAVNHVRDQLIPPAERGRKAWVWKKAVEYLQRQESRVREEVQMVAGEDCRVWRWLPAYSPPTSPLCSSMGGADRGMALSSSKLGVEGGSLQMAPQLHVPRPTIPPSAAHNKLPLSSPAVGNKVWQGKAFEMKDGSVNPLPPSSTPYLKIRNMFDPDVEYGEEWTVRIQDAILEKCEHVSIIHIGVQKSSHDGCVYVKCASGEDARNAYHALHGWWFDGNLVTVKYLRAERYHEHFPNARYASLPLKPSNNERLSLQSEHLNEERDGGLNFERDDL